MTKKAKARKSEKPKALFPGRNRQYFREVQVLLEATVDILCKRERKEGTDITIEHLKGIEIAAKGWRAELEA